jgi:hypothetical protein
MPLPHPRLPLSLLSLGLALHSPHGLAQDSVTLAPVEVSDTYGNDGYQVTEAAVGGFQAAPLLDTPASVSVFNQQLIEDRQVRKLSEVLQSDASVGESYAPIGYYENFNVRGFELNAASSYRINGQTIAGEGGPITIPPDATVTVGGDGTISTISNVDSPAAPAVLGRLKLVNPDTNTLFRGEDGLFRTVNRQPLAADATVQIQAGALEDSNVNAVDSLIATIKNARSFDLQMQLIQRINSNAESASRILNIA